MLQYMGYLPNRASGQKNNVHKWKLVRKSCSTDPSVPMNLSKIGLCVQSFPNSPILGRWEIYWDGNTISRQGTQSWKSAVCYLYITLAICIITTESDWKHLKSIRRQPLEEQLILSHLVLRIQSCFHNKYLSSGSSFCSGFIPIYSVYRTEFSCGFFLCDCESSFVQNFKTKEFTASSDAPHQFSSTVQHSFYVDYWCSAVIWHVTRQVCFHSEVWIISSKHIKVNCVKILYNSVQQPGTYKLFWSMKCRNISL